MNNLPLAVKIAIGIITCLAVGFLSGLATASSVNDWFVTLNKPFFNPPPWLFAPVWTLLYSMMGIAVALVWHEGLEKPAIKTAVHIFIVQLILNALWSIFFFGMKAPFVALVTIVILWLLIYLCIQRFKPINAKASYLLVPYLAWVSFATLLNGAIWWLN